VVVSGLLAVVYIKEKTSHGCAPAGRREQHHSQPLTPRMGANDKR
jgi:hypothetical protein